MSPIDVLVCRLDPEASLPHQAHPGDAGFDLCSLIAVEITPGERVVLPTGLAIALPPGYVALVHPRSGLARKHGLTVTNAPGTIDSGYRGQIEVLVINLDTHDTVRISKGDRIAQLVVQAVPEVVWHEVAELPDSHRGAGGFGSTGEVGKR
jgi:dUTP pyrophosphatase